jgi:predicted RNA-binding Zn-ribbon protein involved in translation (DUF1610 family)
MRFNPNTNRKINLMRSSKVRHPSSKRVTVPNMVVATFCKHGIGMDFNCPDCGENRVGAREAKWNKKQHAFVMNKQEPIR